MIEERKAEQVEAVIIRGGFRFSIVAPWLRTRGDVLELAQKLAQERPDVFGTRPKNWTDAGRRKWFFYLRREDVPTIWVAEVGRESAESELWFSFPAVLNAE